MKNIVYRTMITVSLLSFFIVCEGCSEITPITHGVTSREREALDREREEWKMEWEKKTPTFNLEENNRRITEQRIVEAGGIEEYRKQRQKDRERITEAIERANDPRAKKEQEERERAEVAAERQKKIDAAFGGTTIKIGDTINVVLHHLGTPNHEEYDKMGAIEDKGRGRFTYNDIAVVYFNDGKITRITRP